MVFSLWIRLAAAGTTLDGMRLLAQELHSWSASWLPIQPLKDSAPPGHVAVCFVHWDIVDVNSAITSVVFIPKDLPQESETI